MPKCRRHIYDQIGGDGDGDGGGGGGGVCASCLRERLLALLSDPEAIPTVLKRSRSTPRAPPQPPPNFPRSVSPYLSHRRSLHEDALQRFYSTPQARRPSTDHDIGVDLPRKRFFFFPFFVRNSRSRSEEINSALKEEKRDFWMSTLIRRRKPIPAAALICSGDGGSGGRRSNLKGQEKACRPIERGMSPARYGDNKSERSGSSSGSGASPGWRQPLPTPMRNEQAPSSRRQKHRGMSGFAVCLSPLMRANPNCRLNPSAAAEAGVAGDARHHHRHGSSGSGWLAHNRSRKMAHGPS